ncbi:MAG: hypothetical protein GXO07_01245, partial [Crenarchaeota archaeon]|nr:hypothetical protein [Thermoproteota archaeon]
QKRGLFLLINPYIYIRSEKGRSELLLTGKGALFSEDEPALILAKMPASEMYYPEGSKEVLKKLMEEVADIVKAVKGAPSGPSPAL